MRWLARFSFSLILLAAVFAWEGRRTQRGERGPGQEGKMYAFYAASLVCFVLGMRAVRERHRSMNERSSPESEIDRDVKR